MQDHDQIQGSLYARAVLKRFSTSDHGEPFSLNEPTLWPFWEQVF